MAYVDNFLYLADIQADKLEPLYVDRVHYNPKLNAEIARYIADFLISHGLEEE